MKADDATLFVAESVNPMEKKAFDTLAPLYDVVKNLNQFDFPIFSTPDYATISFTGNNGFDFRKGCIYELEFDIRKRTYSNNTTVRCFIKESKKIREALSEDLGELVQLE
jgi:hypothetical protein